MTARDLFTLDPDPPSGLGIPQSEKMKEPGAVGSTRPEAVAPDPKRDTAIAEAPKQQQCCGTCGHGVTQPIGFIRCPFRSRGDLSAPKALCKINPIAWKLRDEVTDAKVVATTPLSALPQARAEVDDDPRETYKIRDTSMRAIFQLRADGKISERQKELLEFFADRPVGVNYTRQEIAKQMMMRHGPKWAINQVCGRVKELLDNGRLRELPEYRVCSVTSEKVNAVSRGVW